MSKVGQLERVTQNRVVKLFQEKLDYRFKSLDKSIKACDFNVIPL